MKIKVFGTRGEIEPSLPYHSHHTGVMIDDKILLDLGEKEFLNQKPEIILITHLHPDHAYFIESDEKLKTDIPTYAPEQSDLANLKAIESPIKFEEYKLTPIPTHHSKKVESVAYLIENNNQSILYTGDMVWINKEHWDLWDKLNLVITEGSFIRKGGRVRRDKETGQIYGHTGIPDLLKFFEPHTDRILFIHFGSWFYKDTQKAREKIQELAENYDLEAMVGYDGMVVELSDNN
jgi:ribonuclease BN (tRNA processing enzyme)